MNQQEADQAGSVSACERAGIHLLSAPAGREPAQQPQGQRLWRERSRGRVARAGATAGPRGESNLEREITHRVNIPFREGFSHPHRPLIFGVPTP